MNLINLDVKRIAHDTFRIAGSKVVYTDPFQVKDRDQADLVLLTHDHFDHLSLEDLKKVCAAKTRIVASTNCKDGLKGLEVAGIDYVSPGDHKRVDGVEIHAVPAYNVNKFKAPGQPFHPREHGGVGFVFEMDGTKIYHAGDTDFIPEMESINVDIALLPVSGTYVMTVEEAVEAVDAINPMIAVPMHYGAIVGSEEDAKHFKDLVRICRVEIVD
jgi:L-ascorbate metabolism protein UlaG (beta-lactamase superfamily)